MIIITGASKGLGLSIAERLKSKGNKILSLARDTSNINHEAFDCDVSNYEQLKEVSSYIKKNEITVTGLINAAGIASMNLAITTPANLVKKIINTNLIGTIFCCQVFSPFMIRKKKGSIINFSTIAVPLSLKGESVYVASKSGVEGFSKSFARELSDFNINVNCIAPGPINTDLIRGVSDNKIKNILTQQIISKQFEKNDICNLVEILLDQKSNSLSGQILNVGGV